MVAEGLGQLQQTWAEAGIGKGHMTKFTLGP
jgi:hypothetical protein